MTEEALMLRRRGTNRFRPAVVGTRVIKAGWELLEDAIEGTIKLIDPDLSNPVVVRWDDATEEWHRPSQLLALPEEQQTFPIRHEANPVPVPVPVVGETGATEPAAEGMKVVLVTNLVGGLVGDPEERRAKTGRVLTVMPSLHPDDPILVEWPDDQRGWYSPDQLRATSWPMDSAASAVPDAIQVDPDAAVSFAVDPDPGEPGEDVSLDSMIERYCTIYQNNFAMELAEQPEVKDRAPLWADNPEWVKKARRGAMHKLLDAINLDKGAATQVVRRAELLEARQEAERLSQQIRHLSEIIAFEVPGEPSASEGAVETAIRLIRRLVDNDHERRVVNAEHDVAAQAQPEAPETDRADSLYELGALLAEIEDRELRHAAAFLSGLTSVIPEQSQMVEPSSPADRHGHALTPGMAVHQAGDPEQSAVGWVKSVYKDVAGQWRVSVAWSRGIIVHSPSNLVVV
jgi:hypothetical protein